MYAVESYGAVRRFVLVEGHSRRKAAKTFGLSRGTVDKMCQFSEPPGYRLKTPPAKPKLDGFTSIIDAIVKADAHAPKKQRHTAKRIFERLRDEHGFQGGTTIVSDYVREARQRSAEVFVPLHHPPGHAQVDFGEAIVELEGVRRKGHVFFMSLPYSDASFMKGSSSPEGFHLQALTEPDVNLSVHPAPAVQAVAHFVKHQCAKSLGLRHAIAAIH